MTNNFININSNLQGDASYFLRKVLVTPIYVDFELTIFSERWDEVDIMLEYRRDSRDLWKNDADITQTTAKYFRNNQLCGLSASKEGILHNLRWQYSSNNLMYGNNIEVQIKFVSRIRMFGSVNNYHSISTFYGDGLNDFQGMSKHNCIGINQSGNYICLGNKSIYIVDSLSAEEESTSSESSSSSNS